jgi:hypothetical protein
MFTKSSIAKKEMPPSLMANGMVPPSNIIAKVNRGSRCAAVGTQDLHCFTEMLLGSWLLERRERDLASVFPPEAFTLVLLCLRILSVSKSIYFFLAS